MLQEHGERAIKVLQKRFLYWLEEAEELKGVHPNRFNDIRKEVFRKTFQAFRLGIIGVDPNVDSEVYEVVEVFSWKHIHEEDIAERGLAVLLVCFRTGAAVALGE